MKFNRRDTIRQLAMGAGAAFSGSFFPNSAFASVSASAPKRVIFFLQNQGFGIISEIFILTLGFLRKHYYRFGKHSYYHPYQ